MNGTLDSSARAFRPVLQRAKKKIAGIPWYPHDSLGAVEQIRPLLKDTNLLTEARSLPLLDLGCGDGDLAFLFESLGFAVTAVDYELSNFNQMRGVRALRQALGSSITIHTADLDGRFQIPGGPFGLCLMLGVLYHVKNPFYLLEYVAQKAQYCLLTTRVARQTPRGTEFGGEALAYLVDATELNNDRTNYWIFSPASLRRIATRAGWNIRGLISTGCIDGSDPVHPNADERACLLLESRIRVGSRVTLLEGWHDLEQGTYRWTGPSFAVRLETGGVRLRFRFTTTRPVTVFAEVNGITLAPASFDQPGEQIYTSEMPDGATGPIEVRFKVDPPLHVAGDDRSLGVLVSFWREGVETCDANAPVEIL